VLYFFLSHTHGAVDDMAKFHADLSDRIRVLAGKKNEEVGFFDDTSLEGGDEWPSELYAKLATCRCFIALYSDRYFRSEFCGRELRVFLDRLEAYNRASGRRANALIPIKWTMTVTPRHPVLRDFQDEDTHFGDANHESGLWPIITLDSHREKYDTFLRRLAEKIYRTANTHAIPDAEPGLDIRAIRSAFHDDRIGSAGGESSPVRGAPDQYRRHINPTSRLVHFIVAAGQRQHMDEVVHRQDLRYYGDCCLDWAPYLPDERDPLIVHAGRVVAKQGSLDVEFACVEELAERVEFASQNNQMLIVLVDLWATQLNGHLAALKSYDRRTDPDPVLIVTNTADEDTSLNQDILWAQMASVLRRTSKSRYSGGYRVDCMTLERFTDALEKALLAAWDRRLKRAKSRAGDRASKRSPVLEGPTGSEEET